MELGNRVLVVDDERTVCESVRKVLSRQGLPVDQASSVEEGLRRIEQGADYAAVIVDLVMPRVGGEELLKIVKDRKPATSVVIMTGYASIESAVRATKLGAFDYITKPFTPDELREVTRKAIKRHQEAQSGAAPVPPAPPKGKIDVDLPFDETELESNTSRLYAETVTHTDVPVGARGLPKNYCVKGEMVCKRLERQGIPCEDECPILARRRRLEASEQPRAEALATDLIDIDMPFSAQEVAEATSPEYVACLGRFGMPIAAHWTKTEEARAERKVLVVDDEVVVCNSVRKVLARKGYQVDETDDGGEALRRLQKVPYELVILDMVMPKMNGIDVLREIKQRQPETSVIMITGYASIDSAKEAIRLGASEYLPKPFTPDELLRVAESVAA